MACLTARPVIACRHESARLNGVSVTLTKKIMVITTGGTIGSILKSDHVAVEASASKIAAEIEAVKQKLGFEVEVVSPINKNSEVLSPADWIVVLNSIEDGCNSDCDGIVVTHGTDTMAYTVAAAVAFRRLWNKKVCFTGAFLSPDHPRSDTALSLSAALEFAASPQPGQGVYVAFRSDADNREAKILNGIDIKPMGFDDAVFHSLYDAVVSRYCPTAGLSDDALSGPECVPAQSPALDQTELPSEVAVAAAQKKIAYLHVYPGIDKALLQAVSAGKDVVVLQLYHSGTGPFGDEYSDVIDHITACCDDTLFLLGSFPAKHITTPYGSTHALMASGGALYRDLQSHFLYVFALLALSSGNSQSDIRTLLSGWEMRC